MPQSTVQHADTKTRYYNPYTIHVHEQVSQRGHGKYVLQVYYSGHELAAIFRHQYIYNTTQMQTTSDDKHQNAHRIEHRAAIPWHSDTDTDKPRCVTSLTVLLTVFLLLLFFLLFLIIIILI
eukprot:scpid98052/ scgid9399/ 